MSKRRGKPRSKSKRVNRTSTLEARLSALGYESYVLYLRSEHWSSLRRRFLDKRCCACSSKARLQLHHVSYARLGAEVAGDLRTLCAPCHRLLHRRGGSLDPAVTLRDVMVRSRPQKKMLPLPRPSPPEEVMERRLRAARRSEFPLEAMREARGR